MNHDRPLFKNNPQLAKAVNWAIDRQAILNQGGFLAGKRNDQILPPGLPGGKDIGVYPLSVTANTVKKAQSLANGHTGSGKAILYTSNRAPAPQQAAIYQFNLKQIGLDVEVQQFARAVQIEKEGTRGADFDFTTEGWIADYADPYDFINVLLSGDSLHDANNNNVAYYNSPKFNKAMTAASNLSGNARYAAYQALDKNITTQDPAWAARVELQRPPLRVGAHRWLHVPAGVRVRLRDGVHQVTIELELSTKVGAGTAPALTGSIATPAQPDCQATITPLR